MNQAEEILATAGHYADTRYKEAGTNRTIFGEWYGLQDSWCVMFISYCANKAGIPQSIIPKMAYVPFFYTFFKNRQQYHETRCVLLKNKYKPVPGDIVFYGSKSHVGLVEKFDGRYIYTIEGNTSSGNSGSQSNGDGVYRRKRDILDDWVMGFAHPDYVVDEEDEGMIYNKVSEIPSWGTATVNKLISKGALKGDTSGLNLNETMLRIFVILDRLGKLD